MNIGQDDTTTSAGSAPPPADTGQPAFDPSRLRDLDPLRRTPYDRYVAGVAGGLGRHLGIDPVILRVLFVVLAFFGGAGILLYLALWLLTPEEGADRAPIALRRETRQVLLIVAAAVAVLALGGNLALGFRPGWLVVIGVATVLVLVISRNRTSEHTAFRSGPESGDRPGPDLPTGSEQPTAPAASWAPPGPPPVHERSAPRRPRRPPRTGMLWFWPTVALILIGEGVLAIVAGQTHVVAAAFPALALAIIGVMLVVGSVTGRPGGLIALGLLGTVALGAGIAVDAVHPGHAEHLNLAPTSAAGVSSNYAIGTGTINLDLRNVSDPAALSGRTIHVFAHVGDLTVRIPEGVDVQVRADTRWVGAIQVFGQQVAGFRNDLMAGEHPVSGQSPLRLYLNADIGHLEVTH